MRRYKTERGQIIRRGVRKKMRWLVNPASKEKVPEHKYRAKEPSVRIMHTMPFSIASPAASLENDASIITSLHLPAHPLSVMSARGLG